MCVDVHWTLLQDDVYYRNEPVTMSANALDDYAYAMVYGSCMIMMIQTGQGLSPEMLP